MKSKGFVNYAILNLKFCFKLFHKFELSCLHVQRLGKSMELAETKDA